MLSTELYALMARRHIKIFFKILKRALAHLVDIIERCKTVLGIAETWIRLWIKMGNTGNKKLEIQSSFFTSGKPHME